MTEREDMQSLSASSARSLELVDRYGLLYGDAVDPRHRAQLLAELLMDMLRHRGLEARPIHSVLPDGAAVAVTAGGRSLFIEATVSTVDEMALIAELQNAAANRPRVQFVLLSIQGTGTTAVGAGEPTTAHTVILLDRSHLEAVLYGLLTPEELFTELAHRADFAHTPWTSLTDLLIHPPAAPAPQLVSPDRCPAPWPLVLNSVSGVQVRHMYSGDQSWGQPVGCTAVDGRLLITVTDGVLQVDLERGTVDWLLPLTGCRGAPLIRPDGTIMILYRDGVIAWNHGVLTIVGGGIPDARVLLTGPGDRPWVLSGNGPAMGSGTSTLALTRLGEDPGQQHRRPIHFDADVRSAAWLDDLRFYLAAAGHSAVIDLARSNGVRQEDWIVSPHDRADHIVVIDPYTVVTASSGHNGVRASVYRTHLDTRDSDLLTGVASNRVDGLTQGPDAELLLLGDVRGNDVSVPHPLLLSIKDTSSPTGQAPSAAPATPGNAAADSAPTSTLADVGSRSGAMHEPSHRPASVVEPSRRVSVEARGTRRDYRLEHRPLAPAGGQGTVYGATHKGTNQRVAFKRLHIITDDQRARLRREVDAALLFGGHPNVMPVLDYNIAEGWFVMPVASYSAQARLADLTGTPALRALITAICEALREPHQLGWMHRDLKPDNVLWLEDRWVVTDWGLGRRPRGQTTDPHRTHIGGQFGTEGFAAPELSIDAHDVGPTADVYSIGQIIGWALTATWPRANIPLLPTPGPWRNVVEAATQANPQNRPAAVDDLLAIIAAELDA